MTTHQVLHVLHTLHTTCLGHLSCSPISATSQKQTNQPKSSQENTDRVTATKREGSSGVSNTTHLHRCRRRSFIMMGDVLAGGHHHRVGDSSMLHWERHEVLECAETHRETLLTLWTLGVIGVSVCRDWGGWHRWSGPTAIWWRGVLSRGRWRGHIRSGGWRRGQMSLTTIPPRLTRHLTHVWRGVHRWKTRA